MANLFAQRIETELACLGETPKRGLTTPSTDVGTNKILGGVIILLPWDHCRLFAILLLESKNVGPLLLTVLVDEDGKSLRALGDAQDAHEHGSADALGAVDRLPPVHTTAHSWQIVVPVPGKNLHEAVVLHLVRGCRRDVPSCNLEDVFRSKDGPIRKLVVLCHGLAAVLDVVSMLIEALTTDVSILGDPFLLSLLDD